MKNKYMEMKSKSTKVNTVDFQRCQKSTNDKSVSDANSAYSR